MRADWREVPLAHWLLLATLALLPFGAASEAPVLIGAVAGSVALLRRRIDWRSPTVRCAFVLGLAYWLPQLLSSFDSVVPDKSWRETALDLRFVPFLLYVANTRGDARTARFLVAGVAIITLLWCADALVQATTGFSLGGAASSDRLSGIFGADNLKLGGVLAVLAPFALVAAWRRGGVWVLAAVALVLLIVILLAGARAAWFGFALGAALVFWQMLGRRRALTALLALTLATLVAGIAGYAMSERFAQRVDRTATALAGDREALDHALSGRLPIWDIAWRMGQDHPVNGVGVRGFRHAYPEFAAADDPFLHADGQQGAFHAHQIVLELWSETGLLGLLCWLAALALGIALWRATPVASRALAQPAGIALIVTLFPLNTHYAVYSAFWGLVLVWLVGVWLVLLGADTRQTGSPHD